MQVILPWPDKSLSPNARVHWQTKAKATREARKLAFWIAFKEKAVCADKLAVSLTFNPPDKRRRDIDGMLSSCKAYLDGIADATDVDDSKWDISIRRGDPVKGGQVRVEIEVAS